MPSLRRYLAAGLLVVAILDIPSWSAAGPEYGNSEPGPVTLAYEPAVEEEPVPSPSRFADQDEVTQSQPAPARPSESGNASKPTPGSANDPRPSPPTSPGKLAEVASTPTPNPKSSEPPPGLSLFDRLAIISIGLAGLAIASFLLRFALTQRAALAQLVQDIGPLKPLVEEVKRGTITIAAQVTELVEAQKKTKAPLGIDEIRQAVGHAVTEQIGTTRQAPGPSATERLAIERQIKELATKQAECKKREEKLKDAQEEHSRTVAADKAEVDRKTVEINIREAALRVAEEKVEAANRNSANQLAEAARVREEAEKLGIAAEGAKESAQKANERADAAEAAAREVLARIEAIRDRFWPEFFRGDGRLAEWREPVEVSGVRNDSAGPLLLNALHRYCYLRKAAQPHDLARTIKEISRHAYAFWAESGLTAEQSDELSEEWARTFEADLTKFGRDLNIRVARIGQQKDNRWMNYRPGSGPVALVETWGVQASKGVTLEQAEVS